MTERLDWDTIFQAVIVLVIAGAITWLTLLFSERRRK